jgi:hypothetical protein
VTVGVVDYSGGGGGSERNGKEIKKEIKLCGKVSGLVFGCFVGLLKRNKKSKPNDF